MERVKYTIIAPSDIHMGCLDVPPQIINIKVFWAVWLFLPDALVNSCNVQQWSAETEPVCQMIEI